MHNASCKVYPLTTLNCIIFNNYLQPQSLLKLLLGAELGSVSALLLAAVLGAGGKTSVAPKDKHMEDY
jgi:hypothetical protein